MVPNCTPYVPVDLCNNCPLNVRNIQDYKDAPDGGCRSGDFINCGRMFEIDSEDCEASIRKMAEYTPCDTKLPEFIKIYYEDNPGPEYNYAKDRAGQLLDRYVYSLCEQCCDCIPCGSEEADPNTPIEVERVNCPVHWKFDVCAIYPDANYYSEDFPLLYTYASTDSGGRRLQQNGPLRRRIVGGVLNGDGEGAPTPSIDLAPEMTLKPSPLGTGPSPSTTGPAPAYLPPPMCTEPG